MKKILAIALFILFLDIITKQLIVNSLFEHQSITIIKNFFYLTYAKNDGIAFSFLEGKVPFIIIMTVIVIFLILKYLKENDPTKIEMYCYGLIIGGAIGNLLDRVLYGYVIDFLDFYLFSYHFPIFNLADTSIVIGIFIIFIASLKESNKERSDKFDNHRRRKNKSR